MLVSDNVSPDTSVYYLGGILISLIDNREKEFDFFDIYKIIKDEHEVSVKLLILTLDWLYLLDLIDLNEDGSFVKCF